MSALTTRFYVYLSVVGITVLGPGFLATLVGSSGKGPGEAIETIVGVTIMLFVLLPIYIVVPLTALAVVASVDALCFGGPFREPEAALDGRASGHQEDDPAIKRRRYRRDLRSLE